MLQKSDVIAHLVSRRGDACNNVHNSRVNLAGIGLAGHRIASVKSHLRRDLRIELVKLFLIVIEQFLERRLRAGGAFAAKELQGRNHVLNVRKVHAEFLQPQRRALAHGRRLRRLKMRKRKRRQALILIRELRKLINHVHKLLAHKRKGVAHHDDVGVVADIAARSTQMDDAGRLRALQSVGVDVAHDIVAHQLLALLRHGVVDVIDVTLHLINHLLRDDGLSVLGKAQFHLGFRQRNPKLSPSGKLLVLTENVLHLRGGISLREGACVTVGVAHDYSPVSKKCRYLRGGADGFADRVAPRKMKP